MVLIATLCFRQVTTPALGTPHLLNQEGSYLVSGAETA